MYIIKYWCEAITLAVCKQAKGHTILQQVHTVLLLLLCIKHIFYCPPSDNMSVINCRSNAFCCCWYCPSFSVLFKARRYVGHVWNATIQIQESQVSSTISVGTFIIQYTCEPYLCVLLVGWSFLVITWPSKTEKEVGGSCVQRGPELYSSSHLTF